ncbi:MAG: hypothetical protein V7K50_12735 [Nostoc sp.]|uniref:hypothetical protein n=1 Tax=Nostoc sp. TaxID=1180 RepID=UPI002FF903EF
MDFRKFYIPTVMAGLASLSPIVFSQAAFADGWPTSVVGNWSINADNYTGILSITNQATTGNCRTISGSIFGDSLTGFYCPYSGRINFIRRNNFNQVQVYSANISQTNASTVTIGGLFTDYAQPGEYSFFGSK